MNGQKRPPPAFQEYASDTLANIDFRLLSLSERGLRTTMRLECWVNGYVPANPKELAVILNLSASEVERAFTQRLLSLFVRQGDKLFCQDLENYREALLNKRQAQSEGGRSGGKKTQKNIKDIKNQNESTPQAKLQARVKVLRREEERREESPRGEQSSDEISNWIKDFSSASPAVVNEYLKQSKGC
jgi:hypothetical protein